MSERKRPPENARLPLPAPRPGAALDEKIIAYARAKAPQRQRPHSGRWMAGLATAGIVAVARRGPGQSVVPAPSPRMGPVVGAG